LFGVYAVADPHESDLEDLSYTVMHKLAGLCYTVNDDDVQRAKNQLKTSILFSQDGLTGESWLAGCWAVVVEAAAVAVGWVVWR
jgi:hypothetical protein